MINFVIVFLRHTREAHELLAQSCQSYCRTPSHNQGSLCVHLICVSRLLHVIARRNCSQYFTRAQSCEGYYVQITGNLLHEIRVFVRIYQMK